MFPTLDKNEIMSLKVDFVTFRHVGDLGLAVGVSNSIPFIDGSVLYW